MSTYEILCFFSFRTFAVNFFFFPRFIMIEKRSTMEDRNSICTVCLYCTGREKKKKKKKKGEC